jgi:AraC-like DNA-binding protein
MMHLEACALEASRDYQRIEHAIRYLDENASRQPGLEEVSREIGLSPFHAQRLFTRFAGVSPKRFLGLLTVGHAKTLLQDGREVGGGGNPRAHRTGSGDVRGPALSG